MYFVDLFSEIFIYSERIERNIINNYQMFHQIWIGNQTYFNWMHTFHNWIKLFVFSLHVSVFANSNSQYLYICTQIKSILLLEIAQDYIYEFREVVRTGFSWQSYHISETHNLNTQSLYVSENRNMLDFIDFSKFKT